MAKQYDKEQLLIDWRTGEFTQRDLASKHKISAALVNRLVKDVEQDLLNTVNKKLELTQELALKSEQEVNTINRVVDYKMGLIKDIEFFSNHAMRVATNLLTMTETGNDFKAIVEAVDKISITNNINKRHAEPSSTTIQNNTQNNFESLPDVDLLRRMKEVDERVKTIID